MAMYGQEEAADSTIDQLCLDKDPVLRYGGMYAIAMAYAGTSNNAAIRRLLHVAVSDVNNDVRRAAVLSLGFLMLKTPDKLPELIALLSESYNPHVRYGAAMALGIGCSGMADPSAALKLLQVLTVDKVGMCVLHLRCIE
jgi:26S proteasome regulatory subunit N2